MDAGVKTPQCPHLSSHYWGTSQLVTRSTRHTVKSCAELTIVSDGIVNYGHFGPKTLRTLDTSALVWWVRTVRTDRHRCGSVL